MNKFFGYIQEHVMDKLLLVAENKYLEAIRKGMMLLIPFTIIGSVFTIVTNFPITAWTDFIEPYAGYIKIGNTLTFGMMAVIAVVGISYSMATSLNINQIATTIIGLIGFLMLQVNPATFEISMDNFGSSGLFTAIVVGIVTAKIMEFFLKHNIVIKLPKSVPGYVSDSFTALIPALAVILLCWVIRVPFNFDLNTFITTLLSPLMTSLNTLPGILVLVLISLFLWSCGINGESVVGGVYYTVTLSYLAENIAAKEAGLPLPYITADGFYYFGMWMGGTGAVLILAILMIRSKSKTYRALGKVSVPPSIFHIIEPIMFGFPVCLNPIIIIPFILTPVVCLTLTYALMYFNILARPIMAIPWTTPPFLNVYLATGGDFKAVIWQAVEFVIGFVIYYPFFKICEKATLKEEAEAEALEEQTNGE